MYICKRFIEVLCHQEIEVQKFNVKWEKNGEFMENNLQTRMLLIKFELKLLGCDAIFGHSEDIHKISGVNITLSRRSEGILNNVLNILQRSFSRSYCQLIFLSNLGFYKYQQILFTTLSKTGCTNC
jgi:hypothetical protein